VTRVLSPEHIAAMQLGRKIKRQEADLRARERVAAWREWVAAGSDIRCIPEVPTDLDYEIAGRR